MGRFVPNENTVILFTLVPPGGVNAPAAPTLSSATVGGHLVPGTYGYRVVALNAEGHSLPSQVATIVVPAGTQTNEVTVTWEPVDGATGYAVYGRSGTLQRKIGTTDQATTTFADDGSVAPAGRLPKTDTSANISNVSLTRDVEPAVDLTDLTMSFNASSQGNSVPTPSFARLFETSILGTSQATFTADFYRDDEEDLAWDTLPRATKGYFIVTRYGGEIVEGDEVEVWPVTVLSRAMGNMTSNTVVMFTVTCAVPREPDEEALVAA